MIHCINIYCCTTENLTRHHLITKAYRFGKKYGVVYLCEDCHKRVHRLKTNTELSKYYNTKGSLIKLLENDLEFRIQRMLNINQMQAA